MREILSSPRDQQYVYTQKTLHTFAISNAWLLSCKGWVACTRVGVIGQWLNAILGFLVRIMQLYVFFIVMIITLNVPLVRQTFGTYKQARVLCT